MAAAAAPQINTELHETVRQSNEAAVCELLNHGANPDACDDNGETPLLIACRNGNVELARLLLRNKANPDTTHEKAGAPVAVAAANGHAALITLLLEYGLDLEDRSYNRVLNNKSPMVLAIENNHADVLRVLMDAGAVSTNQKELSDDINRPNTDLGRLAIDLHRFDILRMMIDWMVRYNSRKELVDRMIDDAIARVAACTAANATLFEYLYSLKGPSFDLTTYMFTSRELGCIMQECGKGGNPQILRFLLARGGVLTECPDGKYPIFYAAQGGHLEAVRIMLEEARPPVDPNGPAFRGHSSDEAREYGNTCGWTTLMGAASNGHLDMVRYLLAKGADPHSVSMDGNTALSVAVAHLSIVNVLIDLNPDLYIETPRGGLLDLAARAGNPGVITLLLTRGVKGINGRPEDDMHLPLAIAAECGHVGACQVLLNYGADVNHTLPNSDVSALDEAVNAGQTEVVRLLLSRGARVEPLQAEGDDAARTMSPLHSACMQGHLDCVKLLLDNGANIEREEGHREETWTPICSAIVYKHNDVARYLVSRGAVVPPSAYKDAVKQNNEELFKVVEPHVASQVSDDDKLTLLGNFLTTQPTHSLYIFDALTAALDVNEPILPEDRSKPDTLLNLVLTAPGQFDVVLVRSLLARGANPNAIDQGGQSPLMHAVHQDSLEAVKLLLAHGADPTYTLPPPGKGKANANKAGSVLLATFRNSSRATIDMWETLLDAGADKLMVGKGCYHKPSDLFEQAVKREAPYAFPPLLKRYANKIDVNHAVKIDKRTVLPIEVAARCGAVVSVRALLDAGAHVRVKTDQGQDPLIVSVCRRMSEAYGATCTILRLLLTHGADVNALTEIAGPDDQEVGEFLPTRSALACAGQRDGPLNMRLIQMLLDWGAAVELELIGPAAWHFHIYHGHARAARLIQEYGLTLDAVDFRDYLLRDEVREYLTAPIVNRRESPCYTITRGGATYRIMPWTHQLHALAPRSFRITIRTLIHLRQAASSSLPPLSGNASEASPGGVASSGGGNGVGWDLPLEMLEHVIACLWEEESIARQLVYVVDK